MELQTEETGLTVEIPFEKVYVGNLTNLLEFKGELIKEALGINDIRIEMLEDMVAFPWFDDINPDDGKAYAEFISALCTFTKNFVRRL